MKRRADVDSLRQANRRLALKLGAVAVAMFGFGYALVPLYDAFCRATGLNGKPGDAAAKAMGIDSRWITVEFTGDVMPGLPWRLEPLQLKMRVHPGRTANAAYRVSNLADRPSEGRAIPSVSPPLAAKHFKKIECFCFSQQRLAARETREMTVSFIVSGELPPEVSVLTLSYAFFPSAIGAQEAKT